MVPARRCLSGFAALEGGSAIPSGMHVTRGTSRRWACSSPTESQHVQGWQGPLWVTQPNPLPKQGHPEQAAQHRGQAGLEYLQRRRLQTLVLDDVTWSNFPEHHRLHQVARNIRSDVKAFRSVCYPSVVSPGRAEPRFQSSHGHSAGRLCCSQRVWRPASDAAGSMPWGAAVLAAERRAQSHPSSAATRDGGRAWAARGQGARTCGALGGSTGVSQQSN